MNWIWRRGGFEDNAEVLSTWVSVPRSRKLPLTKMEEAMERTGLERENKKYSIGQVKSEIPTIHLSDEQ